MPHRIVHRLLHQPVNARAVFVRQAVDRIVGGDHHVQSRALAGFPRVPVQRRHQAEIVQHRRAQQQRQIAHLVHRLLRQPLDRIRDVPGHRPACSAHSAPSVSIRIAERDCPISSCSSRASARRSFSWARNSRVESSCKSARRRVQLPFQPENEADRHQRQEQAAAERTRERPQKVTPYAVRRGRRPLFGPRQPQFVHRSDAVCNLKHGGAPRDQFVVEERGAQPIPFLRRPSDAGIQNLPVGIDLIAQRLKRLPFLRLQTAAVSIQRACRSHA